MKKIIFTILIILISIFCLTSFFYSWNEIYKIDNGLYSVKTLGEELALDRKYLQLKSDRIFTLIIFIVSIFLVFKLNSSFKVFKR
jgi:uncharacterized protein YxeA